MGQWSNGAMGQWGSGAVEQWSSKAPTLQRSNAPVLQRNLRKGGKNMPGAYARYSTGAAYENDVIIKASPGRLYSVIGESSKATAQWIQIHDSAVVPADGAVPLIRIRVVENSNFNFTCEWRELPVFCSKGIYICNSTTGPTKTLGNDDCLFYVIFK